MFEKVIITAIFYKFFRPQISCHRSFNSSFCSRTFFSFCISQAHQRNRKCKNFFWSMEEIFNSKSLQRCADRLLPMMNYFAVASVLWVLCVPSSAVLSLFLASIALIFGVSCGYNFAVIYSLHNLFEEELKSELLAEKELKLLSKRRTLRKSLSLGTGIGWRTQRNSRNSLQIWAMWKKVI